MFALLTCGAGGTKDAKYSKPLALYTMCLMGKVA